MTQPIIKWTGSKRSQSDEIIQYFPDNIDTYYEPFCGGCSMMMKLLNTPNISVNHIVCSDLNNDLIETWKHIKDRPDTLFCIYNTLYNELISLPNVDEKRKMFENIRNRYNDTHDPCLFFWIMRTCTNGMPRYNKMGQFNNSFHLTRNGITPENLKPILYEWSQKLNSKNVEFINCSYEEIFHKSKDGDFLYLDPPYFNTKGLYYGGLDFEKFFNELGDVNNRCVKYVMSFDGKSGDVDNTCDVPNNLYTQHFYIKSGNSSFKRTIGKDRHAMVYESLYINFEKESDGLW